MVLGKNLVDAFVAHVEKGTFLPPFHDAEESVAGEYWCSSLCVDGHEERR
eukprot:CAMPEP_0170585242 /NCGR_PEP_ID=MMETSP0224-20130122/9106_1 /TAXON_ID=285029 /ORGANISM="Togula jolla, Strain CCCM 725" /LENGTH=49 /DNA_ID=CAMNT_0010908707 /DNA_START=938 /DNA_END=1087 /DNA_ORIENTATION=-